MKKALLMLALVSAAGFASADCGGGNDNKDGGANPSKGCQVGGSGGNGGNGGNGGAGGSGGTGVGVGIGIAGAAANAVANAAAVASSTATNNTNVGVIAGGGNATGGSVRDSGNSTNVIVTSVDTKGTVGDVTNKQGQVQGQQQGQQQSISGSGNATIQSGAVVVNMQNAEAEETRALTDRETAGINASATVEAAQIAADALRDAANSKIRNTPSVNGPPLVSSNDTCMGSASGSVNVPGFGIGAGKTYVDDNCVMLKNSRELWNMGMKAAALALMCNDKANKEALELTGFVCPQTAAQQKAAAQAVKPAHTSAAYQGSDPVVMQRLGLTANNVAAK